MFYVFCSLPPKPVKPAADIVLFVEPVLTTPQIFDLTYYANALTPTFAMESLVGRLITTFWLLLTKFVDNLFW